MKQVLALLASLAVCGLLAAGCSKNNPVAPNMTSDQGKCLFSISAAEDIASGLVVLTKGQVQKTAPITIVDHTGTVLFENLQVGTWAIDVKLFDSEENEIYSGQGTALVRKGQTTRVTIRVQANTGSLEIIVEVPEDGGTTPTVTPTAIPTATAFRILFNDSTGELYSVNEDGTGLQEVEVGDSVRTFDPVPGENVIYYSEGNYIYRYFGSGSQLLPLQGAYPRLSPDGNRLLLQELIDDQIHLNHYGSYGGYKMDLLLSVSTTGVLRGCWTPNGRILYSSKYTVDAQEIMHVMNSDGSNNTVIDTGGLHARLQDCASDNTVLFTDPMVDDLYAMNLDGTGLHKLMESYVMAVYQARFSPDGQKIVFTGVPEVNDNGRIYTLNRDGSGLHEIPGIMGVSAAFTTLAQ